VDTPDAQLRTPLHHASSKNDVECVLLLLKHEADVHAQTIGGRTPLHYAAASGSVETAELLLEHDAKANAPDKRNLSPLLLAYSKGMVQCAELLLRHLNLDQLDFSGKDRNGRTLCHFLSFNGHMEPLKVGFPFAVDQICVFSGWCVIDSHLALALFLPVFLCHTSIPS
jgi:ankyrin repeat protein